MRKNLKNAMYVIGFIFAVITFYLIYISYTWCAFVSALTGYKVLAEFEKQAEYENAAKKFENNQNNS